MIVNIISKVYGPSKKKLYEAGADLGLMNFELLGFFIFFERNKPYTIELSGDLNT